MKKRTLIILVTGVCLLTACNNTNIGIIGGEDGPTSIIVGEQNDFPIGTEYENHSFIGTILEETTEYIIVEPNEDTAERKSSDKIRINLNTLYKDYLYGVGRKVIINYTGLIKETYPAQITTNDIDVDGYDDFEISVKVADKKESKKILNNSELSKYTGDYALHYVGLEEVSVKVDNKDMTLEKALRDGYLTLEGIIAKCNREVDEVEKNWPPEGVYKSITVPNPYKLNYKDGGSVEFHYEDYTIIKCNTLDDHRDMYICDSKTTLNDLDI